MGAISQLAQTQTIWIYLFIFFGKVLEVSVATLRIVLINRGIRAVGSLIAVLEMTIWLVITSAVLAGIQSDPLKIVVYAVAFATGNFLGSWLDEKLAFGLSSVQAIIPDDKVAHELASDLREQGFGITMLTAQGMGDENRYMLLLMIRRKRLSNVLEYIAQYDEHIVVTVSDVKAQKGGYFRNAAGGGLSSLFK